MPSTKADLPILDLRDRAAWSAWLDAHHDTPAGVWLKIAKKGSTAATPTYQDALEEAIAYGWIDGQRRSHDDRHYLQRFTPRRPTSKWSQINRQTAERLIAENRMHPAGLEQVRAAQNDGRWESAYEPQSRATVPPDLQHALDQNPEANEFFQTLTGARRYAFLFRLHHVKRPQARAARIARYIDLLTQRKTLHDD
jgi:uncharacterized protein YdeI (YjbR/CyaY-like superfamily)